MCSKCSKCEEFQSEQTYTIELTPHEILAVRMALSTMDLAVRIVMTEKMKVSKDSVLQKLTQIKE